MQKVILKIVAFLIAYKWILLGGAAAYLLILWWAWRKWGPKDRTGNGITVGQAKAFDNRSLTLRIERLSNQLAALKVVTQSVADSTGKAQEQTSTQTTRAVTLEAKPKPGTKPKDKEDESTDTKEKKSGSNSSDDASESKPAVQLGASDLLSEQLNLASQILNLEMLYERSLTDRLLDDKTRLQTVLGFQVSITPSRGFENSVAIVEIGVRLKSNNSLPVSLVALIPQEKTYNSQTVSTSAYSIGGSAVTNILTLGVNRKGESRQLFIHRDSDTIAFERDAEDETSGERVFGWEFRPVLGRRSVTPGARQMLAVIALPVEDPQERHETPANADAGIADQGDLRTTDSQKKITLEIRTRSYWRHFNPRKQTTGKKWSLLPWRIDRSLPVESRVELPIPTTNEIQGALAPRVKDVKWVNSGGDRATVIVTGSNFFTGTKVVIGGEAHAEDDEKHKLTLKSNQALEFETTMAALGKGDCVLIGRFGPSCQLLASLKAAREKQIQALTVVRAVIYPSAFSEAVYLSIDVKAINERADDVPFEVADIQKLPEPILFVGAESVPLPYDYFDVNPRRPQQEPQPDMPPLSSPPLTSPPLSSPPVSSPPVSSPPLSSVPLTSPPLTSPPLTSPPPVSSQRLADSPETPTDFQPITILATESTEKYVRVGAWISKKLAANPSVTFRVPFCGLEYQASVPLTYSDPTIDRMGDEDDYCVFRIASPLGFKKPFQVELDEVYKEVPVDDPYQGRPQLKKTSPFDYRFKVPKKTAARYKNIVIRTADEGLYLLPIPSAEKPKPKPHLVTSGKPPQVKKDRVGSVEWSGTALDAIQKVTLVVKSQKPSADSTTHPELEFTVYDDGQKIEVYLTEANTAVAGKAELEFVTSENTSLVAPIFITAGDS